MRNEKPPAKSLNYSVKRKEAERIDKENHKIMERIVSQGPILSTKKLVQDYEEVKKIKKMKEKALGISVEKLLEKKKKLQDEVKSTIPILPALGGTKMNSP
jgi:hypothetical protein